MNKVEFEYRMKKNGDTRETLCELLGCKKATLSRKLNCNRSDFFRNEIELLKDHWNLTPEEVDIIFFTANVS